MNPDEVRIQHIQSVLLRAGLGHGVPLDMTDEEAVEWRVANSRRVAETIWQELAMYTDQCTAPLSAQIDELRSAVKNLKRQQRNRFAAAR